MLLRTVQVPLKAPLPGAQPTWAVARALPTTQGCFWISVFGSAPIVSGFIPFASPSLAINLFSQTAKIKQLDAN
jgi:hypothetical protein